MKKPWTWKKKVNKHETTISNFYLRLGTGVSGGNRRPNCPDPGIDSLGYPIPLWRTGKLLACMGNSNFNRFNHKGLV